MGKNKVEKKFKQAKAMGAADKSKIELWPVATISFEISVLRPSKNGQSLCSCWYEESGW